MKTIKKLFMAVVLAVGIIGGAIWINPPQVVVRELIEVPVKPDERPINDIVRESAKKYGLSEWLLMAVARHESGLANDAIRFEPSQMERARVAAKKLGISRPDEVRMMSSSIGLMQVMAWHAPSLGLKSWRDLLDPETNIDAGAQILRACMDKKKSIKGALGCYNGDPDQYPRLVLAELGEMMVEEM